MESRSKKRLSLPLLRPRLSAGVDHRPIEPLPKFGVIYLEDNTPVRTIKVTNFPENTTSEYLRGYFEVASGPIDNVSMVSENEEPAAYITFRVPEDAAKMIGFSNLGFDMITIKEAESVYQPKLDPNALKLEDVIDDCLIHIISRLDLIDVINLGATCTRLRTLTKLFYARVYAKSRSFIFDGPNAEDLSINESSLPRILGNIGSYIQSLELHHLNLNVLDMFSKCCPNVNSLKIIYPSSSLSSTTFKNYKLFFANIEILVIQNSSFFDTSMNYICSTKLKSLTLVQCSNIRGTFLRKLKKLQVLKMIGFKKLTQFENQHIFDCQRNNQLTVFATDVCGCSYNHFLANIDRLQHIQELALDFSRFNGKTSELDNLNLLTRLTKLTVTRRLSTNSLFPNLNTFLLKLSEISTLESLEIEYIELRIDTLEHIKAIKNLKRLHLGIMNNPIGNEFYKTVPLHLPNLIELRIRCAPNLHNPNDYEFISKMIRELRNLDYFYYSGITMTLLEIILKDVQQSLSRQSRITIEISKLTADDQQKNEFEAASKGSIILNIQ